MSGLDDWQLAALERAREKLKQDPEDSTARTVVEEFLDWSRTGREPQSFSWFSV